jgi:hypothetical protein
LTIILTWWFDFRLETIFDTAPAASRNATHIQNGQKWLKNNHLTYFTNSSLKSLLHSV